MGFPEAAGVPEKREAPANTEQERPSQKLRIDQPMEVRID